MFLYRVKDTESEYDIQNDGLLCKLDKKYQNTFEMLENVRKELFYYMYNFHNSYFVIFVKFVFLYLYILHV